MAALATRLGSACQGLSALSGPCKLLAAPQVQTKVCSANIYSKTSGMLEPRLKPWPYETLGFNHLFALLDGTTKRFNDNSKVIVVEGPPGLEKSKLAKELADELDMVYVPGASMEEFYINQYGYDLRELDTLFTYPRNVSYDEKKFAQDPLGQQGGLDRMQHALLVMRYGKYVDLLAHLFNTGQGVVTERSPYSDYVFTEACYKMGWIDRTTRAYFNKIRQQMLPELLRPNLIVYLDAPVDVVQAKIRERANTTHPWEKNSPVFENTQYLTLLYEDLMKKQYIKEAAASSRVLMYDWSEGGDTEVLVEDIERLNMDYFDKYDKQQMDWRMFKEDNYTRCRLVYTDRCEVMNNIRVDYFDHKNILQPAEEILEFQFNAHKLPGSRYALGYNEEMGDSVVFKPGYKNCTRGDVYYGMDLASISNDAWENYWSLRQEKKARGEEKWWQF